MTETEPVPWRSGSPQSRRLQEGDLEPSGENIGLDNAAPGTLINDRMTVPTRLTWTIRPAARAPRGWSTRGDHEGEKKSSFVFRVMFLIPHSDRSASGQR